MAARAKAKQLAGETIEETRDRLAREKLKAREDRNRLQAIEEKEAWQAIQDTANAHMGAVAKRKGGQPKYSETERDRIQVEICERLSVGQSLNKICQMPDMPPITTVMGWIGKDQAFEERYARARELAAHSLFDQCIDIADDATGDVLKDGSANHAAISRAKLRVDTRMRMAGKLSPKVYGERVEGLASGTVNITNNSLTLDARSLSPDQRDSLRAMLLQASDRAKLIDG